MSETLLEQAAEVGRLLREARAVMSTAESCTGGWVAQAITAVPGSSEWFDSGFVTYSNDAKMHMLQVKAKTLESEGAVSEAVVREMVSGAIQASLANTAVAISGIAGPDGGSDEKPVGTVWIAWAHEEARKAQRFHFHGDREQVRLQAVEAALAGMQEILLAGGGAANDETL